MYSVTPQLGNVMSLLKSGSAFTPPVSAAITAATAGIGSAVGGLSGLATSIPGFSADALVGRLSGIAAPGGALLSLTSHITDHLANLPQNLAMAVGQINVQAGLVSVGQSLDNLGNVGTPGGPDICSGITGLFGSIMTEGSALVGQIASAIGEIQSLIAEISALPGELMNALIATKQAAISAAIGLIEDASHAITKMISDEVSALAKALGDMLNFSSASSLANLFKNPCAKMVLNSVASSALHSLL